MPQRPISFLVVFLFAFLGHISGQQKAGSVRNDIKGGKVITGIYDCFDMSRMKALQLKIKPEDRIKLPVNYGALFNFNFDIQLRLDDANVDSLKKVNQETLITFSRSIPDPAYYSRHLGFFCQKEIQLQKLTNVPVRLRLGSLDYVNYLEQKPNAGKPR
jgi:hypothetical protein